MADEWIKIRVDLSDDPTVFMMAELLSIECPTVVGHLVAFWGWMDRHTPDGKQLKLTDSMIDAKIRLPGFASALRKVGWLTGNSMNLEIPNFDRHNTASGKARALEAEAKRIRRTLGKTPEKEPVKSVGQVSDKKEPKSPTREEKRREDIKPKDTPNGVSKKTPAKSFDYSSWPSLPEQQTLEDWFAMRKRIKADVSQTVITAFAKQFDLAAEAGVSVNTCLQECVSRNWRGFKFQWLVNQEQRDANSSQNSGNGPHSTGGPQKLSTVGRNNRAADDYLARFEAEES